MPLSSHSYSCPRSPSPHPIYSLMVEPTCSRHSLSVLLHASCGRSSHGHCVRSRQQRALVLGWIGVSQAVTNGVGGVLLPARPSRAILPGGARPGWHVRPNGITPQPVNLTASATTANHVQPLNAISFPGLTITKASLVVMPTISSLAPPAPPPHKRCARFELRFLREQFVVQDRLFILRKRGDVGERVSKRVTVRLQERAVTKLAFHILRGYIYITEYAYTRPLTHPLTRLLKRLHTCSLRVRAL